MIAGILDPDLQDCNELEAIVAMAESPVRERLIEGVLNLGCKVYVAKSPEDALSKLQFHPFHIAVVEEDYGLEIIEFLASLPMSSRRNVFYALLGESFETNNFMQAYVFSANLVVNRQEADSFPKLLLNGILNNNRFFRPMIHSVEAAFS